MINRFVSVIWFLKHSVLTVIFFSFKCNSVWPEKALFPACLYLVSGIYRYFILYEMFQKKLWRWWHNMGCPGAGDMTNWNWIWTQLHQCFSSMNQTSCKHLNWIKGSLQNVAHVDNRGSGWLNTMQNIVFSPVHCEILSQWNKASLMSEAYTVWISASCDDMKLTCHSLH